MVGKDNPFSGSRKFYVFYDSAQGLQENTPVMYNGYKVGQLKKLELTEDARKIMGTLEVYSNLQIPKNSLLKIESELLGGMKLKLRLGNSKNYAVDGDTLLPEYTKDVISLVNEKIATIAAGADSLLVHVNALISRASVQQTFDQFPALVANLNQTILQIKSSVEAIQPGIGTTMNNIAGFSSNLESYNASIKTGLSSFNRIAKQVDSIQLNTLVSNVESTIASLQTMINGISSGTGTLGKLAKDDALYNSLVQTSNSLQCLSTDLKKYPEKYLPLPWGKRQRRVAKEKSELNNCFPEKQSGN